eukprot:s1531_g20.t1
MSKILLGCIQENLAGMFRMFEPSFRAHHSKYFKIAKKRKMVFPDPLSLAAKPEMTRDPSGIGSGERIMQSILFLNLGKSAPKMVAGIVDSRLTGYGCRLDFLAMSSGQRT